MINVTKIHFINLEVMNTGTLKHSYVYFGYWVNLAYSYASTEGRKNDKSECDSQPILQELWNV